MPLRKKNISLSGSYIAVMRLLLIVHKSDISHDTHSGLQGIGINIPFDTSRPDMPNQNSAQGKF